MVIKTVSDIVAFWKRQKRNWRIVVTRMVFNRLFDRLTVQYANIFIRKLGATPIQLGLVDSSAGLASTFLSVPVGRLHDRYSLRKLFTFGVGMLTVASLIYGFAFNWLMVIPALMMGRVYLTLFHCNVICDVSLKDEDRATAKALCEGVGSIPSLIAPIMAAYIITFRGGISTSSIRFLYWIQFAGRLFLLLFIAKQLKEIARVKFGERPRFLSDFRELFDRGTALKRFMAFWTVGTFTMSMATPYRFPFAHEIKGAEQFVLGLMTFASLSTTVLFATPIGRMADRIGRKKAFYVIMPILCISDLLLVFAPNPEILIISEFLQGFMMILRIVVQSAMIPELVPRDCVGRWRGMLNLVGGLASFSGSIIGGVVWETLGPAYVFLVPVAVNLLVRVPIIATIPETLKLKRGS